MKEVTKELLDDSFMVFCGVWVAPCSLTIIFAILLMGSIPFVATLLTFTICSPIVFFVIFFSLKASIKKNFGGEVDSRKVYLLEYSDNEKTNLTSTPQTKTMQK